MHLIIYKNQGHGLVVTRGRSLVKNSLGILGRIAALVLPANPLQYHTLLARQAQVELVPLVYQKNHWTMCRPAGDTRRARLAIPIQLAKFLAARPRRCGFIDSALRARLAVLPLFLYISEHIYVHACMYKYVETQYVAVEAATRLSVLRATSQTGSSSGAVRSELRVRGEGMFYLYYYQKSHNRSMYTRM
uniref:Uncharacterized protein n=1 Tax=Trichogramma kaykai TaxID=54128 RepID=A0ABD2W241_9HYME